MRVKEGRVFIGRFNAKADLLGSLTDLCKKENIRLGVFSVIGALTNVKLGYYNQDAKKYVENCSLEKKLEITSCTGNVSLKGSEIFVHAHITLADHAGQCYGGHLMPGSFIFAAEYFAQELTGAVLTRKPDLETGLSLWVK
ncbi:MAG: DNA-binding protein [Omnitrophica bacterium]|nr:DNA-binding protein [Candidatus Omnitrophota bacterium]